jgi:hypothetical protein
VVPTSLSTSDRSLRSLGEFFLGSVPETSRRDLLVEKAAAESSGLVVRRQRSKRPRTAFFDIRAVVYFLRLVPWIVPGFTVDRHRRRLRDLHEMIERRAAFETMASRTLIEAVKPGARSLPRCRYVPTRRVWIG